MFPVAVQVYSVRDDAAADMMGTLTKIRKMGYDGVEFAGFYGYKAEDIASMLRELGLTAVSSHVPFDQLRNDLEAVVAYHNALDCKYIAVPYLEEEDRPGTPGFSQTIADIDRIGRYCHEHGIQLLYHNHDFEFVKLDGKYALDVLYDSIPADFLKTEIDTCWVNVAGEDPAAYIRKYTGRAPLVHLKDFVMPNRGAKEGLYNLITKDGETDGQHADRESFDFRPVGYGEQDFPSILAASKDAGAEWIIVEQDRSTQRPPMEAIRMSREYLRTVGC